jgi:hypothetical protein
VNNESSFDAEENTPERATELSPAIAFPWPPSEGESIVAAFMTTWRESAFRPSRFFADMPPTQRIGPSLLYFLALGIIVAAIKLFWSLVLQAPETDDAAVPNALAALRSISPIIGFLISPLMQLMILFVSAAVTQVMLLLLVPQRGPYARTVRMYCYTYSPALFTVVPYVGVLVAGIWSLVIAIIAAREVHRTTTGRAIAVILLPTFLVLILLIVLMFVVLASVMMAG